MQKYRLTLQGKILIGMIAILILLLVGAISFEIAKGEQKTFSQNNAEKRATTTEAVASVSTETSVNTEISNQNKININNNILSVTEKSIADKQSEEASIIKSMVKKKEQSYELEKTLKDKVIQTNLLQKNLTDGKQKADLLVKKLSDIKHEVNKFDKQLSDKQSNVVEVDKTLDVKENEVTKIDKELKDNIVSLKNIELNIEQKTKETKDINNEISTRGKELSILIEKMKTANTIKNQGAKESSVLTQTSIAVTNSKKVDIFYSPHPDDEVLSMGMAIAECVKKGDEVHVVLLTHGYDSNAINILNGNVYCNWDHRRHNPEKEGYKKFTKQEMGNDRVKEFISSAIDLGVNKNNIHICNYDEDSVSSYEMKLVMLGFEKQYPGAYHQTTSYHDAHPFHKKLGETLLALYNSKQIKNAEFYISPVQWKQVQGTMESFGNVKNKVINSLNDYKKWDPSHNEFGIGYHSYPEPFNIDEKQLSSKFHFAENN